jgi:hypothetical protein
MPTTMHDRGGHGTPAHRGQRTFFQPSLVHNGGKTAQVALVPQLQRLTHIRTCITHSPHAMAGVWWSHRVTTFLRMPRRSKRGDARAVAVGSGGAAAAASPTPASSTCFAEHVDGVKAHLTTLHVRDAELLAVIETANAVHDAEVEQARAVRDAAIERATAEHKAVRAEMALAESELDALVCAPVSGGRDPFEWLPDELIVKIMLMLPFEVLWVGACDRVCLRWARLIESTPVKRHKRDGRWAAYEAGVIEPRELEGHTECVYALAVGIDGKVYSGSCDKTIRVWSGTDGWNLQTIVGPTHTVCALAVGLDGKIYSGSYDTTIRVWSGDDGTHIQALVGHTTFVSALAVGLDGKIYSGSYDTTIRVWSGDDGTHLQTLEGHTGTIYALAVGLNGKVYSGSGEKGIRVWSGDDGTHIQTLVGHTSYVSALAVGLDGKKVYSGSWDGTIRVWSGVDGTHLRTLHGHAHRVSALAVGVDGKVYSGSVDHTIRVWSPTGTHLHTLMKHNDNGRSVNALAVMRDGTLVSGGGYDYDADDVRCAELKMW